MKTLLRKRQNTSWFLLLTCLHTSSATSSMQRTEGPTDGALCEYHPEHAQKRWLHTNKTQPHKVPLFMEVAYNCLQLSSNNPEGWNGKLIPLDMNFKTVERGSKLIFI